MRLSKTRTRRYLRWHFQRLRDGQSKIVFLPTHEQFTYLRRDGDQLFVIPPFGWPGFHVKVK